MKIKHLNGEKTYYGVLSGAQNVINSRKLLNKINVFPVPDGDTGTNLASMMNLIIQNVKPQSSSKATMSSIADAALEGARGNSGIIFAQFLAGLAQELDDDSKLSVFSFANAVEKAVPHVYQAVAEPVEGTMITVINDWAEELSNLKNNTNDFKELFTSSIAAAKESLTRTTNQLEALRESGVVDAGAKGFVKFLEGIVDFLEGKGISNLKSFAGEEIAEVSSPATNHSAGDFRYCTEIFLSDMTGEVEAIKEQLGNYGDSIVVAETKDNLRVHIHTNQPEEVVYNLSQLGTIVRQKVDDMKTQTAVTQNRKYEIALVTDSIADLPQALIENHQIQVIPLNLSLAGDNYLDKLTMTPEKFYSLLKEIDGQAASSQPTYKQVENLFSFLTSHYDAIIAVTVASKLSGTWNIVNQAAEKYRTENNKIEVIDSKLNSGAEGLVVLETAEKIAKGWKIEEIVDYIGALVGRTEIYVSVDTVKYMVKGGRISRPKGWLAGFLNLKPIITLDDSGAGVSFDQAFTKQGLKNKIKQLVRGIYEREGIKRYAIVHAQAKDQAEKYAQEIASILGQEAEYIMPISPVVGLNAGPGSIAISLIRES
ncbi:MAG: DAK2 domain-containing protein [Bacillota bacterium]